MINDRDYRSDGHEDSAVIEGLQKIYLKYNYKQRFMLIDCLSELAISYSENKTIVEIMTNKVKENKEGSTAFYSQLEHLLIKAQEKPEEFMLNLLGKEEWSQLRTKLENRDEKEKIKLYAKIY